MPSNKDRPRKFQDIACNNKDVLANLYKHSLTILKIQETVRLGLGSPLAQHLYVANISPDAIIIFAETQAWATKLRFHIPEIINTAKRITGFQNMESVRIKVSPLLATSIIPGSTISISPSTTRLLKKVANSINDTALHTALLKLSRNK